MKSITLVVLVFIAGFMTACTTTTHKVTGMLHSPVPADAVMVYHEMPPNAQVIGVLSADSFAGATLDQASADALSSLRTEAGQMGANGILVAPANDQPMSGAKLQAKAIYVSH